jgi:hypothetical protein
MMPQLLTARVDRPGRRRPVRIWVPVLPILLIVSPLLVLAGIVAAVACLIYRISITRAATSLWQVLSALPGTRLDIGHGGTVVAVTIN